MSLLLCHGCHSVSVSLKNLTASLDAKKKKNPALENPATPMREAPPLWKAALRPSHDSTLPGVLYIDVISILCVCVSECEYE